MANLDLNRLDLSNISSTNTAYGNTKLCLILMANELADKLKGTGLQNSQIITIKIENQITIINL